MEGAGKSGAPSSDYAGSITLSVHLLDNVNYLLLRPNRDDLFYARFTTARSFCLFVSCSFISLVPLLLLSPRHHPWFTFV